MNTILSWTAILLVVGGLAWNWNGRPNILAKISPQARARLSDKMEKVEKKAKPKRVAKGDAKATSAQQNAYSEGPSTKKRKITTSQNDTKPDVAIQVAEFEEADFSNKDFAHQMAQAQAGTQLKPVAKQAPSKKERRANKILQVAQDTSDSPDLSAAPSGAEADDDMSPVGSPPMAPINGTSSRNVTDMLEQRAAGPSVLRLTDPKGTIGQTKSKPTQKHVEVAETKKQRQARQKREEQKRLNDEAETTRKALMEKQMKIARMAEGTSAQQKANKPPASNVWAQKAGNTNTNVPSAPVGQAPLFDTFESPEMDNPNNAESIKTATISDITNGHAAIDGTVNTVKQSLGTGRTEALAASTRENGIDPGSSTQSNASWADDLPSEEEQMRALQQEDAWTTVSKKDKKKGAKDSVSEANAPEPSKQDAPIRKAPAAPIKPQAQVATTRFSGLHVQDTENQDSKW